ncbi:hypothetical protein HFP57_00845 [Parasphingopyxis algicola]|uniref:DUF6356 family protein n=1 Tax=Parasphingopyxis algicola TaxID=2026624 RepID=UPI0015A240A9|nr:DUF6356 family protein [Parasphingopyxis algicola]QLC23720.1 hypothetical protein HFP57_00845 [Parasphingopyxis algicola]
MTRFLTTHLRDVSESYGQHLVAASGFGMRMIAAGALCVLHGIFPFLCQQTASETVRRLHDEMVVKRRRAYLEDWVI